jgi:hypothetical protein
MESLVIHAVSLESATGFSAALEAFNAKLVTDEDGSYRVEISLGGGNREILAVLNALEAYVSERGGSARLHLSGRPYTLHPADGPQEAPGAHGGDGPSPN